MMRLSHLVLFLGHVYGAYRYGPVRSAQLVATDGFGSAQLRLDGYFDTLKKFSAGI